jgi:hypothetical protein
MRQIIDFSNYKAPEYLKVKSPARDNNPKQQIDISEEEYNLTLNILVNNNPNKFCFTLEEVGKQLNVSREFLRRRIKSGIIKVIYFGDKPMINITELARILTLGVK